ncbi:MAG: cytochrome c3 family protein [Desulfobacula sp.]|jgi:predicted CXXCH cytochrome family protein|nr:cytochrome c3 family protein [Desulfobacula sp.]
MKILSFHIITKCMVVAIVFLIYTSTCSFAGITGSAHDFSGETWNTTSEICVACHTPHNASQTVSEAPLWNHEINVATTYTVYTSTTLDATVGQPLGITKLCLSCHDGTIALDSFGNATGTDFISPGAKVGLDLSDDHPVSFTWNHGSLNPWDGSSGKCTNCHNSIGEGPEFLPLPFYTYGGGPAKLECSTCHDPHNNGPGVKLLRKTNAGSELCLWCHSK